MGGERGGGVIAWRRTSIRLYTSLLLRIPPLLTPVFKAVRKKIIFFTGLIMTVQSRTKNLGQKGDISNSYDKKTLVRNGRCTREANIHRIRHVQNQDLY